jgi:release factor glutamine methyltransferase
VTPAVAEELEAGRALLAAAGLALPDLEARLLLSHASGIDGAGLIARGREPLSAAASARFAGLLARRSQGVPAAYLTGEREFWSLRLAVDPRVLVPRPETETLVEAASARIGGGGRYVDLGTGSGAIVIALAGEVRGGTWWATDLSVDALQVARANAAAHGLAGRITWRHGDLFGPLAGMEGRFDAVVSNPPYIPTGDIAGLEPDVRDHEPHCALDGGPDGLRVVARLIDEAPRFLRRGGWLLVEIGAGQAPAVRQLIGLRAVWERVEILPDLAGIERVVALKAA